MAIGVRNLLPTLVFGACPLMAYGPAWAEPSAVRESVAGVAEPKLTTERRSGRMRPFLPDGFDAPTMVETAGFKVVPLGPSLATVDYDAYMSSIEHLQKNFSRSTDWPRADISHADAARDMETERTRFRHRQSFAYAVLTPDGSRERGCVYVSPSSVEGYDAVVRLWVTKDEYAAGFDAELYEWARDWMRTAWPFLRVAYPGRSVDWKTWDTMVAAKTRPTIGPGKEKR